VQNTTVRDSPVGRTCRSLSTINSCDASFRLQVSRWRLYQRCSVGCSVGWSLGLRDAARDVINEIYPPWKGRWFIINAMLNSIGTRWQARVFVRPCVPHQSIRLWPTRSSPLWAVWLMSLHGLVCRIRRTSPTMPADIPMGHGISIGTPYWSVDLSSDGGRVIDGETV